MTNSLGKRFYKSADLVEIKKITVCRLAKLLEESLAVLISEDESYRRYLEFSNNLSDFTQDVCNR